MVKGRNYRSGNPVLDGDDALVLVPGATYSEIRLMGAIEVRDGKIVRYADYLDTWKARTA
jgi:limonene-1,2-epoxide hydrolase